MNIREGEEERVLEESEDNSKRRGESSLFGVPHQLDISQKYQTGRQRW